VGLSPQVTAELAARDSTLTLGSLLKSGWGIVWVHGAHGSLNGLAQSQSYEATTNVVSDAPDGIEERHAQRLQ
jgi:hypothetical protein